MANKRKCKHCGIYTNDFIVTGVMAFCNYDHAAKWAYNNKAKGKAVAQKQARKATREAKERIKTRSEWLREAQAACNKYIRTRDENLPCISCGRHHQGKYDAGHYRSVGSSPELRFDEINIHKQCGPCNRHLSGNLISYRTNLVKRIGQDKVDYLEGPHKPKKYTIEEIKAIKQMFKDRTKALDNTAS